MGTARLQLDAETSELLHAFGFDEQTFEEQRQRLRSGATLAESNFIEGTVEPPHELDVSTLPSLGSPQRETLARRGAAAIAGGEIGAVVLAGGMATRFGGVVKAGVEVLPGQSFLALKLRDIRSAAERAGGRVPVYVMTSFATHAEVERLVAPHQSEAAPITCFPQFVSLRLTKTGEIFHDAYGKPSPYAPGHGDLTFALRRAGLLEQFRSAGGRHLMMSNVDNLTATLDSAVVGAHLESGAAVTVEVADKLPGDKGGAPARVDGRVEIVESFRFPKDFDQDRIPVFNTNTMLFQAEAIDRDFDLSWFVVEKTVDGKVAIQFEHLVGQLTALLPSAFLRVERVGLEARFQPVKTPDDLPVEVPTIEAVLNARGVL